ncbi:MAG: hypothetical protein ABJD68_13155, partial [Nakamurella sp.]
MLPPMAPAGSAPAARTVLVGAPPAITTTTVPATIGWAGVDWAGVDWAGVDWAGVDWASPSWPARLPAVANGASSWPAQLAFPISHTPASPTSGQQIPVTVYAIN